MQTKATLISVVALFLLVASVPAEEFHWINTATALQYWDVNGSWSAPGFPRQIGDAAGFNDIDEYAGERRVELNVNDYYTCSVIRCVADTNRYTVYINTYVANGLFMEAESGNAAIILDDNFVSNTPSLAIAGHQLHILSPTDITVSNAAARMDISAHMYGSASINKYGPGQVRATQTGDYAGTITVYEGQLYCGNESNLYAATVVAKTGTTIQYDYYTLLGALPVPAHIVLEGGWLYNNGNTSDGKRFANLTVNGEGYVTSKYYNTFFMESTKGTGTLHIVARPVYVLGHVHPGFSIGELTMRRDSGTLYVGTNGMPMTLHIETSPGGSDHLSFENLDAASTIVLSNINLVVEGSGTGLQTNWVLTSNRMLAGSEFNNVSYIPGLFGEVIYDYANNRVGLLAAPEPAVTLLAACVLASLARRR